jgi:hypothetical protein
MISATNVTFKKKEKKDEPHGELFLLRLKASISESGVC